jgi:putative hydrolase of the HAD superfamily
MRCVAFDLDGVLIPSEPSFEFFEAKHNITQDDFRQFFRDSYDLAMLGQVDLLEILPPFLEAWKWNGTVEEFAHAWFQSCANPEPAGLEIVQSLRNYGIPCYAVSNQDNRRAAFLDSMSWLMESFNLCFYSCRLGVRKPSCEYFHMVQGEIAVAPQSILFVDDRIENVEAARGCGWVAEHCNGPADLKLIVSKYFPALFVI